MLSRRIARTAHILIATLLGATSGCNSNSPATVTKATPAPDPAPQSNEVAAAKTFDEEVAKGISKLPTMPTDGFLPAASQEPVIMRGVIEHMEWTKSGESWNAGGSDYYVLVRDDLAAGAQEHQRRVILRASPQFKTLDDLKPFAGQRVEVRGRRAGFIKYRVDLRSQYAGFPDKDGYLSHGGGLLIDAVTRLNAGASPTR